MLSGKLTKNLQVWRHFKVVKGDFRFDPESGRFDFPEIERLAPGQIGHAEPGGQGDRERARPAATSTSPTTGWARRVGSRT